MMTWGGERERERDDGERERVESLKNKTTTKISKDTQNEQTTFFHHDVPIVYYFV